jgi:cytochrome P450
MTSPDTVTPHLPWDPADPYPFYEECRRRDGAVVWDDTAQAWLVFGYPEARQVLGEPEFSSDPLANPTAGAAMDPLAREFSGRSMLLTDGAVHDRLRGSVRDAFTRSAVAGLTDGVEAIAAAVIDEPLAGTEFDFMSRIALPLPVGLIAAWFDLASDAANLLRELSPAIIRMLGTLADTEETQAGAAASAALMAEFLPLAADRRGRPGEDLLSFIAADPDLELDDVVTTATLLAVAGHETTANLLGAALIRLLSAEPDGTCLADHVDTADPAVITELLRLDGPVQATLRTATADTSIGDTEIHAGATVLVVIAAANRDPAIFAKPKAFRPDRSGPAPLSFGYGAHYCLGSHLARLEIGTALPRILVRRPTLVGAPTWRDTAAIRGPQSIPTVFGR